MFSLTALALAVVGIYGVLAYSVAQRQHELGIRLALGAATSDILRLVVRQGLLLAGSGVVIGLIAALLMTKLMSSLLYKVGTHDVATFVFAPLLFLGIAVITSYVPGPTRYQGRSYGGDAVGDSNPFCDSGAVG